MSGEGGYTVTSPDPTNVTSNAATVVAGGRVMTIPASRTYSGQITTRSSSGSGGFNTLFTYAVMVPVSILVDETGKVIDVRAETNESGLEKKIQKRALEWKFKPLSVDGVSYKMRAKIWVVYNKPFRN